MRKKLYFMRKPEVMEEHIYENRDKRLTYYYRKPDEQRTRSERYEKSCSSKTSKQTMKQSRRSIYIIQIILILGIVFYYGWTNKDIIKRKLGLYKSPVEYFIRAISYPETDEIEVFVNLKNNAKKPKLLQKNHHIVYFVIKGEQKHQKGEGFKTIDKELATGEAMVISSFRFKDSDPHSIKSVGVIINNETIIEKEFQFSKTKK